MSDDAVLPTERLELSPWRVDEAERLLDIRSRPEIAKWLGDPTVWTELTTATDAIESWQTLMATAPPFGVWAVRPRGGMAAGSVSLKLLPGDSGEVEIGWTLHPDSTGNGYAQEAAHAVLMRAGAAGIDRVWAIMWPHNSASAAVARAAGMVDLGVVDDPWYGTAEEPTSKMFCWEAGDPSGASNRRTPTVTAFWLSFLNRSGRPHDTPLYDAFHFDDNERDANHLAELVLAGTKQATASLAAEYGTDSPMPQAGDLSVVTDWSGAPLCVIETTRVDIVAFDDVSAEFAAVEGEGDGSLRHWREVHEAYFGRMCVELGVEPSPHMSVVCERFRVVDR